MKKAEPKATKEFTRGNSETAEILLEHQIRTSELIEAWEDLYYVVESTALTQLDIKTAQAKSQSASAQQQAKQILKGF